MMMPLGYGAHLMAALALFESIVRFRTAAPMPVRSDIGEAVWQEED
jgi:hypothetical protein